MQTSVIHLFLLFNYCSPNTHLFYYFQRFFYSFRCFFFTYLMFIFLLYFHLILPNVIVMKNSRPISFFLVVHIFPHFPLFCGFFFSSNLFVLFFTSLIRILHKKYVSFYIHVFTSAFIPFQKQNACKIIQPYNPSLLGLKFANH